MDCGVSIEHRNVRALRCEACAKKKSSEDRHKPKAMAMPIFFASDYPGDLEKCRKCVFWTGYGGSCNYAFMAGQTRLALHNGDTATLYPCKEFKPKKGGRHDGVDG